MIPWALVCVPPSTVHPIKPLYGVPTTRRSVRPAIYKGGLSRKVKFATRCCCCREKDCEKDCVAITTTWKVPCW